MTETDGGDSARRRAQAQAFYGPLANSDSAARRVGWESAATHQLRLCAVVEALEDLPALSSLLDVGCGEGALLAHLRGAGFTGHYLGEDVLPRMVEAARAGTGAALEGSGPAEFRVADSLGGGPAADAVVCSGALNTHTTSDEAGAGADGTHDAAIRDALAALWERARHVLVVDLAVRGRHQGGAGLAAADLGAAWEVARTLAPVVVVREDVAPGEALLILRRDRRSTLARLVGASPPEAAAGDTGAVAIARARIHLAAREPQAALDTLAGVRSAEGAAWRGLAALAAGRARDAEATLAAIAGTCPQARLHLAVVYLATRRAPLAAQLLTTLASAADVPTQVADEARLLLAQRARADGDEQARGRWRQAIADPFLAREA